MMHSYGQLSHERSSPNDRRNFARTSPPCFIVVSLVKYAFVTRFPAPKNGISCSPERETCTERQILWTVVRSFVWHKISVRNFKSRLCLLQNDSILLIYDFLINFYLIKNYFLIFIEIIRDFNIDNIILFSLFFELYIVYKVKKREKKIIVYNFKILMFSRDCATW